MNIGVIFAGGVGTRMHTKERPKQFLEIYSVPIIIHTLRHFEENDEIDCVVIACVSEWIPYMEALLYKYRIEKVKKIVPGGKTGQLSIYNALCAAEEIANGEKSIVLIHDGVRPLINSSLLSENIACVNKYGSAITTGKVKETILVVNNSNEIVEIPERENSRVAKAPQSFWLNDIISTQRKAISEGLDNMIDSCTLMQHYGFPMHMIDGPYRNIKITTPEDYYTMRALLQAEEDQQIYTDFQGKE